MLRYEDQFTMINFIKSLTPDLQDQVLKSQDPEAASTLVKSGPGEFEFVENIEKAKKGKEKEAVEHVSSTPPNEKEDRDDSNFGNKSTDEVDLDLVKAAIDVLEDYLGKGKPSQVPTQKEVDEGSARTQGEMTKRMGEGTYKPGKEEQAFHKKDPSTGKAPANETMTEEQKKASERHEATHWGVRDRIKKPGATPTKRSGEDEEKKEASEGEDFDLVKASVEVLEDFIAKSEK